jgi:ABC-2 type transport system permease protein
VTLLWRQISDEMLKMFARKRTYIGFGAFLAVQAAILLLLEHPKAKANVSELLSGNGLAFAEYYRGLTLAVVVIVFTFVLLGALYIALVSGDIVAKEVEDGTMRMVLSRPISRLRLLTIKWIAGAAHAVLLVCFLATTALLLATLYKGGLGKLFVFIHEEQLFAFFDTGPGLWRYARAIVCLAYATLVIASLAFMFSCFKMKPAAATILTLSVFFVDLVLQNMPFFRGFREYFVTYHTGFWARTFHEHAPWPSIAVSIVYLAALNITCFAIGAMRFCTRDLKA